MSSMLCVLHIHVLHMYKIRMRAFVSVLNNCMFVHCLGKKDIDSYDIWLGTVCRLLKKSWYVRITQIVIYSYDV